MSRVLRTELRRSAAPAAALLVLVFGAGALYAAPKRWSAGWLDLAMTLREYTLLLVPLVLAAGAWQGRRESRAGLPDLLGSTPRPRAQQVLPVLVALGAAVAAGYLAVLAVGAPSISDTARYLPATAFVVTGVGVLAVVAAAWLGLAVGRLWPSVAAGPVLALAGFACVLALPMVGGLGTVLSPMAGMTPFDDLRTVSGATSAAQGVWLVALAAAAFVVHAARHRRSRAVALLPVLAGVALAGAVVPAAADDVNPVDPGAAELVCSEGTPKVCLTRVHEGLLPQVAPLARRALELLAPLPQAPTEAAEDTTYLTGITAAPAPDPGLDPASTLLFSVAVDEHGGLAHRDDLVLTLIERGLSTGRSCPDGTGGDSGAARAAAFWLLGQEPAPDPSVTDVDPTAEPYDDRVRRLWQGLRDAPEAEALQRVGQLRAGVLACADVSTALDPR